MRQGVPGGADAPDQGAADGGAGVARQVEQERLDDGAGGVAGVLQPLERCDRLGGNCIK